MATAKDSESFKLKLDGTGISIERSVSPPVARQIVALVMGGGADLGLASASDGDAARIAEGFGTVTPKAFMSDKRPTTDMEKVTCLAYFLTNTRKVAAFKTKEITELNIEAAQQKLSNPSATARNAVSEGYLSLAGGGRKQITARGEALVRALPDREKAQSALAAHPIRKARKRRKARKGK